MSPSHGSSLALFVYGGAERGISLASGFFTGESTWKPLWQVASEFGLYIKDLPEHPAGKVDSLAESREATLRSPG